ncbi:MAG: hypothetical protein P8M16_07725 [Acidimicrobiales bacterium]|nr:hypothetical protein [Acidimicrobiales bacterium]
MRKPDDASAVGASLAVSSSGKVGVRMTPLLDPTALDAAAEMARAVTYRAPGN